MDKLDNIISESKENYTADPAFVNKVMAEVATAKAPKRRKFILFRSWPPVLASSLALVAVLVFVTVTLLSPGNSSSKGTSTGKTSPKSTQVVATDTPSSATPVPTSSGPGTDNASLTNDLNNVNSGLGREGQDLSSSNQQQEITVPTD
jgi:hypothetical protein